MRILSTNKIALRALRRNKMRSILTALGIIIGVGAVIAMVSVGNGAKSQVEAQIASLGQNVILVFAGSTNPGGVHTGWGGAGTLKLQDCQAIQREIQQVTVASPEVRGGQQISAGNQNWFTTVLGESAEYLDLRQWPLAAGANFTDEDVRGSKKVAVIGQTVAAQLYGNDNPLATGLERSWGQLCTLDGFTKLAISMNGLGVNSAHLTDSRSSRSQSAFQEPRWRKEEIES